MSTCVDLFVVADFFALDTLCKRATHLLVECLVANAKTIQSFFFKATRKSNPEIQMLGIFTARKRFIDYFFDTADRVYKIGSTSFKPLKNALLLYPKLTRCVILREDIFGDRLFTDPGLAGFAVDILKSVVAPSEASERVCIPECCSECGQSVALITSFQQIAETGTRVGLHGKCRECNPIGDPDVLISMGLKLWHIEDESRWYYTEDLGEKLTLNYPSSKKRRGNISPPPFHSS